MLKNNPPLTRTPLHPEQIQPASRLAKIGLFDSGVGGLSVLRAVARELPDVDLVYYADQKFCPYGQRPPEEIRALSQRIVEFLLEQDCNVIIVACNTASAAALYALRETFPDVPFIGMEPAVKPAARETRSGKVAVLATLGTLQGDLFAHTRDEHARAVEVLTVYPEDWVERVERGEIDSAETEACVRRVIEPLLDIGVDEIALGCTHYPFLASVIEKITQGRAKLLDPSDAIALQTARVVREEGLQSPTEGATAFYTSGDAIVFARLLEQLLGVRTDNVAHNAL